MAGEDGEDGEAASGAAADRTARGFTPRIVVGSREARRSARVYGSAGEASTAAVGPLSTTRPARITTTSVLISRTTPRLWAMTR